MKRVTTAILMAAATAVAHAEFKTGNDLSDTGAKRSFAIGYVLGVHDATEATRHCSPVGITPGQIGDLVLHLRGTWPCKNSKGATSL